MASTTSGRPSQVRPYSIRRVRVGAACAKPRLDVVTRNAINEGLIPGPRYLAASQEITVAGGLGDEMLPHLPFPEFSFGVVVSGPVWNEGYPANGSSPLSRWFDDRPFRGAMWFQAVGKTFHVELPHVAVQDAEIQLRHFLAEG